MYTNFSARRKHEFSQLEPKQEWEGTAGEI